MEELNTEQKFLIKWICYLLIAIYLSIGFYKYNPDMLKVFYWPLHEHDYGIQNTQVD